MGAPFHKSTDRQQLSVDEPRVDGSIPLKALDLTSGIDSRRNMPDIYRSVLPPSKNWVFRTASGSRKMILGAEFVESKIVTRTPGPLSIVAVPRVHGRTTARKPHPWQTSRWRPMAARLAIAPLGLSRP